MTEVQLLAGLSEEQRNRLAVLADVLLPGGSGLPSASAAGVHEVWIDRTLSANPDLVEPVLAVLDGGVEASAGLAELRAQDGALFDRFAFTVAAAYFMNPQVRRSFGYPGTAPRPLPQFEGEAEFYLEDDVLGPVFARGPIFRQVPDEPAR
jgi:hypothetical protein